MKEKDTRLAVTHTTHLHVRFYFDLSLGRCNYTAPRLSLVS